MSENTHSEQGGSGTKNGSNLIKIKFTPLESSFSPEFSGEIRSLITRSGPKLRAKTCPRGGAVRAQKTPNFELMCACGAPLKFPKNFIFFYFIIFWSRYVSLGIDHSKTVATQHPNLCSPPVPYSCSFLPVIRFSRESN